MRVPTMLMVGLCGALMACGGGGEHRSPTATPAPQSPTPSLYAAPNGRADATGDETDPLSLPMAVARAKPGDRIQLAAGAYGALDLRRVVEGKPIVLSGPGQGRPWRSHPSARFDGGQIAGAEGVTLERVGFTAPVTITGGDKGPSQRVELRDTEFTYPEGNCLTVRGATADLDVIRSWIHDCRIGVNGPGSRSSAPSHDMRFTHNLLQTFSSDAVLIGSWKRVRFSRNTMEGARDPAGKNHNDVFQFVGFTDRITVDSNVLRGSDDQIMLIQPAIGPVTRTVVTNNLIYDSGAFAVQSWAGDLRFVNNTVWDTGADALLVRGGGGEVARDSVIVNNVLSGLQFYDGGGARVVRNNLLSKVTGAPSTGNRIVRDPGFVNAAKADFRLRRRSPGFGKALDRYLPARDLSGRRRSRPGNVGAVG